MAATRKPNYTIELRRLGKYDDPRRCQVDLDAPQEEVAQLITDGPLKNREEEPARVMPLRDVERFVRLLGAATRTFESLDASHFWVSGYYGIVFESNRPVDRARVKGIVRRAVEQAGGFMTAEEWCAAQGARKGGKVVVACGSGSNIAVSSGLDPAYL
jgi:hypothetical protein